MTEQLKGADKEKKDVKQAPDTGSDVAHTPDAEMPDAGATRVGKEVLTEEDEKKAS